MFFYINTFFYNKKKINSLKKIYKLKHILLVRSNKTKKNKYYLKQYILCNKINIIKDTILSYLERVNWSLFFNYPKMYGFNSKKITKNYFKNFNNFINTNVYKPFFKKHVMLHFKKRFNIFNVFSKKYNSLGNYKINTSYRDLYNYNTINDTQSIKNYFVSNTFKKKTFFFENKPYFLKYNVAFRTNYMCLNFYITLFENFVKPNEILSLVFTNDSIYKEQVFKNYIFYKYRDSNKIKTLEEYVRNTIQIKHIGTSMYNYKNVLKLVFLINLNKQHRFLKQLSKIYMYILLLLKHKGSIDILRMFLFLFIKYVRILLPLRKDVIHAMILKDIYYKEDELPLIKKNMRYILKSNNFLTAMHHRFTKKSSKYSRYSYAYDRNRFNHFIYTSKQVQLLESIQNVPNSMFTNNSIYFKYPIFKFMEDISLDNMLLYKQKFLNRHIYDRYHLLKELPIKKRTSKYYLYYMYVSMLKKKYFFLLSKNNNNMNFFDIHYKNYKKYATSYLRRHYYSRKNFLLNNISYTDNMLFKQRVTVENFNIFYNRIYKEHLFEYKPRTIFYYGSTNKFISFLIYNSLKLNEVLHSKYKEYNLRYLVKDIYLFFFFKWFKKKIYGHFFSIFFNYIYNIKKNRLLLKKKINLNNSFNKNLVGTLVYKQTYKTLFFTYLDENNKVMYNITSGILDLTGYDRTSKYTIMNITSTSLKKIVTELRLQRNIHNMKIIITGNLLHIDIFLSEVFKASKRYDRDYNFIYILLDFFKKYMSYIKKKIKGKKKTIKINFNSFLTYLYTYFNIINYLNIKPVPYWFIGFKVPYIQFNNKLFFKK